MVYGVRQVQQWILVKAIQYGRVPEWFIGLVLKTRDTSEQGDPWVRIPLLLMKILYWINLSYACYGIETENDIIVDAPPIANWAKGKTFEEFRKFVKRKNGIIKRKIIA